MSDCKPIDRAEDAERILSPEEKMARAAVSLANAKKTLAQLLVDAAKTQEAIGLTRRSIAQYTDDLGSLLKPIFEGEDKAPIHQMTFAIGGNRVLVVTRSGSDWFYNEMELVKT